MADEGFKASVTFGAIESIGKVLLVFSALCYVAGLIVVNLYLRRFGFSDFSLLRTRFIFTGVIALVPLMVIAYTVSILGIILSRDKDLVSWLKSKKISNFPRSSSGTISLSIVTTLGGVFVLIVTLSVAQLNLGIPLQGIVFLGFSAIMSVIIVGRGLRSMREMSYSKQKSNSGDLSTFRGLVEFATILPLSITLYLLVFSVYFYPRLSEQFGGGEPKAVQLVLFDSFLDEGVQAGLVMEDQSQRSVPIPLLWEGESVYLVYFPDFPRQGWAAQIDKTMVAAVLVYTEPRRGDAFQIPDWYTNPVPFATPQTSVSSKDSAPAATPVPRNHKDS